MTLDPEGLDLGGPSSNSSGDRTPRTYLPSFIEIGLAVQEIIVGQTDRQTDGQGQTIKRFHLLIS